MTLALNDLRVLHGVVRRWSGLPAAMLEGRRTAKQMLRTKCTDVLLSGAAEGADTLFDEAASAAGHEVIHFLGPRNAPSEETLNTHPGSLFYLEDNLLDSQPVDDIVAKVNRERFGLARSDRVSLASCAKTWRDSRRNVFQVRCADAVYAVAYRLNPSPDTPALDVGGGTGCVIVS